MAPLMLSLREVSSKSTSKKAFLASVVSRNAFPVAGLSVRLICNAALKASGISNYKGTVSFSVKRARKKLRCYTQSEGSMSRVITIRPLG